MVVEDKRQITILHEIAMELENNIVQFNRQANGLTDAAKLIELRLRQNEVLTEIVQRHKRHLDFMQGKPVDPQMHFGEVILLPSFGGSL